MSGTDPSLAVQEHVLGVLISADGAAAWAAIAPPLAADHFTDAYRIVYAAIAELAGQGKAHGVLEVVERCNGKIPADLSLVALVRDTVISVENVAEYATRLREQSSPQPLIAKAQRDPWPEPLNIFAELAAPPFHSAPELSILTVTPEAPIFPMILPVPFRVSMLS